MSFQAMTWAVAQTCGSAATKLVLLMLADHANGHTGQCNPRHKLLAAECEMTTDTLKTHIKKLDALGLIEVIPQFAEEVQLPNQYRLKMQGGGGVFQGEGGGKNHPPYNQEDNPERNPERNQAPRKRAAPDKPAMSSAEDLVADGLAEELATGFISYRKTVIRQPLTPMAWGLIKTEAAKAGVTPSDAVTEIVNRGWRGFKAEWLNNGNTRQQPRQFDKDERDRQAMALLWPDAHGDNVIEGTAR